MFKNKNLLIIALIAVVNALGYGIIIPILYRYSLKFGLSDFENGLLFALFSVCQFASTPLIGRLSDKLGRKPLLVTSIVGTAASFFIMAFAPSTIFLFIARALDGITAGNIPVAMAVISDSTKPEERAKGFGLIGAAFGFGFVFGPAISALTVDISDKLPFIIAGVVSVIAVIITALFLPETNKHMGEVKHGKLFDFAKLWHTLFDPRVGPTFLITVVFYLAFACAIIFGFQPYTAHVLNISEKQNAILFTIFGIVGLITQLALVARYSQLLGLKRAFASSLLFTGVSFVIMAFSHSLVMFIFASIILGVFNSIVQTLIPTILSREVDVKSQGTIMGLNASYQSLGMIFGPIIGGALATVLVYLPFLFGAGLVVICLVISTQVLKHGIPAEKESAF
jgi:MFS family permease